MILRSKIMFEAPGHGSANTNVAFHIIRGTSSNPMKKIAGAALLTVVNIAAVSLTMRETFSRPMRKIAPRCGRNFLAHDSQGA